nr:MAG TPA: hypothetical protein [Caudoviricetes sp.]
MFVILYYAYVNLSTFHEHFFVSMLILYSIL